MKQELIDWMVRANKKYDKGNGNYQRLYYVKNKARIKERKIKRYYENRPPPISKEERIKRSRLKARLRNKRYVSKKRGNGGSFTAKEWEELLKKHNHCCVICKKSEPFLEQYYQDLTVDHIIPVSRGGNSYIDNIQPLCHKCNCLKRNSSIL